MTHDSSQLIGLRCLLVNPKLYPTDLRGESHAVSRWKSERALNFGLLVTASQLAKAGAEVDIIDLDETPDTFAESLNRVNPHLVGIGNISCYGFLSTLEVIRKCQETDPSIITVVGGQNAALAQQLYIRAETRPDWLVVGSGETVIVELGKAIKQGRSIDPVPGLLKLGGASPIENVRAIAAAPQVPLEESAFLLYDLYPDWKTHFPIVEESRGCPFGCNFCGNSEKKLKWRRYLSKSPGVIVEELKRARKLWRVTDQKMPAVLMCSNFGTHPGKTVELLSALKNSGSGYSLLAAMRVDTGWEKYVHLMEDLFDQIHFGLESGSPDILLRMEKTTSPKSYLDKAQKAFQAFREKGIHVGCNFILGYPGENGQTLSETILFFLKNRSFIDSLWGGALIEYPGSPFGLLLDRYQKQYGAERHKFSPFNDMIGAYPVTPSKSLSFDQMVHLSLLLMKMFNNKRTFYEHYRWYPGPDVSSSSPLAFYEYEKFFSLYFEGKSDIRDLGLDLS